MRIRYTTGFIQRPLQEERLAYWLDWPPTGIRGFSFSFYLVRKSCILMKGVDSMELFVYVLSIRVLDKLYTYVYSTKELALKAARDYMAGRRDINWHYRANSCWEGRLCCDEKISDIRVDRLQVLNGIETEDDEDEYI